MHRVYRPKIEKKSRTSNKLDFCVRELLVGLSKFFSCTRVDWLDCEPDNCQRVYFANHSSHLDSIVIWSSLPREIREWTRPVAEAIIGGITNF